MGKKWLSEIEEEDRALLNEIEEEQGGAFVIYKYKYIYLQMLQSNVHTHTVTLEKAANLTGKQKP